MVAIANGGARLDVYVPVRFPAAHRDALRRMADRHGTSVSALLRQATVNLLEREGERVAA